MGDAYTERFRGIAAHGHTFFDVAYISEIVPGLYHGGVGLSTQRPAMDLPVEIKHVVQLYGRPFTVAHPITTLLRAHMEDELDQDLEMVYSLADWVNNIRHSEESILVHCQAGLNRSSLVVATALVLNGDVSTGQEAIDLIREKRSPAALCNPAFAEWVKKL